MKTSTWILLIIAGLVLFAPAGFLILTLWVFNDLTAIIFTIYDRIKRNRLYQNSKPIR